MILSIDQSTTSSKVSLVDQNLTTFYRQQIKHQQITPHAGWLQHNSLEIWNNVNNLLEQITSPIQGIAITNQRQTIVVWDQTGKPLYNAIVWCDTRNHQLCQQIIKKVGGKNHFIKITGLPISTYFSAFKLFWLSKQQPEIAKMLAQGNVKIGTIDSWLIYKLTGQHITDHSNASRTFLYNIQKSDWDENLLNFFNISRKCLPNLTDSYGKIAVVKIGKFKGTHILSILGDQQSSAFGLNIQPQQLKITYGTGCFIILNTGEKLLFLQGFLTSVLYRKNTKTIYALQGSIQAGGAHLNWLKQIRLIDSVEQSDHLPQLVKDLGRVKFYPFHGGAYSPYWQNSVSGQIRGLTFHSKRQHIVRAVLQSICFRVAQVLKMIDIKGSIFIEGGLTKNAFLPQYQSQILNKKLVLCEQATMLGVVKAAYIQLNKKCTSEKLKKNVITPKINRQCQLIAWQQTNPLK